MKFLHNKVAKQSIFYTSQHKSGKLRNVWRKKYAQTATNKLFIAKIMESLHLENAVNSIFFNVLSEC